MYNFPLLAAMKYSLRQIQASTTKAHLCAKFILFYFRSKSDATRSNKRPNLLNTIKQRKNVSVTFFIFYLLNWPIRKTWVKILGITQRAIKEVKNNSLYEIGINIFTYIYISFKNFFLHNWEY